MVAVFLAEDEQCCHIVDLFVEWVIDSGASYYVTPRCEFFTSYKPGNFNRVKMSNNSFTIIVGIGDNCI